MTRNIKYSLLLVFLFSWLVSFSQEFTPIVKQFAKKDYSASNQNWAVGQTSDGLMYFGNNQGLLEFDGNLWTIHRLPQNKMARSLMIGKNDRIYVGSFQEFGYFERDSYGYMQYKSLSENLENYDMMNDEIWNIIDYNGTIIFQSFTSYFIFDGKKTKGIRCPLTFLFFNIFNNKIYTHTSQTGFSLLKFGTDQVTPLAKTEIKSPVISVLNFDAKQALLVTKSDGLFLLDVTNVSAFPNNSYY